MKFKTKPKVRVTKNDRRENVNFILHRVNRYRDTEIGNLEIDMSQEKYFVVSAHVNDTYRGNGFGKVLYYDASEEAQWVWVSLHKKYKSRKNFFNGTLTIYNKLK